MDQLLLEQCEMEAAFLLEQLESAAAGAACVSCCWFSNLHITLRLHPSPHAVRAAPRNIRLVLPRSVSLGQLRTLCSRYASGGH